MLLKVFHHLAVKKNVTINEHCIGSGEAECEGITRGPVTIYGGGGIIRKVMGGLF
jgi:hypothetical protein